MKFFQPACVLLNLLLFALAMNPIIAAAAIVAPQPIAPIDNAHTLHEHPHLSWSPIYTPKAVAMPEYLVQIARDKDFNNIVDTDVLAGVITRYIPVLALQPGRYHWRVRGRDATGVLTDWSTGGAFEVVLPGNIYTVPLGSTGSQIQAIIKRAASNSPARVIFEKGEYQVDPGEGFIVLKGTNDLIIDGNGASIILTAKASFVNLQDCANIQIKGFEIDYATMPHIAGKVVNVDSNNQTVDLELLPNYPAFEQAPDIANYTLGMVRTGENFTMKNNQPLVVYTEPGFEHLSGRRYRLKAKSKNDSAAFEIGDTYIKGPRGPAGFSIERSSDVAITDCIMYMCTGIGFPTKQADRLRILNFQFKRKPGRPLVVQNGGQNHHDARIGPWVENCLFENTGDDMCHVNNLAMGIKQKLSPTQLVLYGNLSVQIGDRLQFYHRQTAALVSECNVIEIKRGPRTTTVTLDGDVGQVEPDPASGSLKGYQGTQVFNANRQCNQFVWRNNISRAGRRVGILAKGIGGLIEKNQFLQQGGGAVEIWNAPYEGLYADGYVIRQNKMLECGLVRSKTDSRTLWIFNRYGQSPLHRNILIEENEITDYPCRAMIIKSATNVVIRNNQISNQKFKTFRNNPGVIDFENCQQLIYQNNIMNDTRLPSSESISIIDSTLVTQ